MFRQVQKEDKKNKLLPYSEVIDEEALNHFREIKTNLGLCIMYREMRLPLTFWLSRVSWYIDLYELKFSKEDHILLVKLLYDLVTVPDVPLGLISSVYVPLKKLLSKKKFLVPGEDLILPWRPMYNLCRRIFWCGYPKITVIKMPGHLKIHLEDLVLQVRFYFDPSATSEILDELRPFLCPSDGVAMKYAVQMLSLFLPLTGSPNLADKTHQLWLTDMLRLWEACSNNSFNWDDCMMHLLAHLALLNVGNIVWDEHIPTMYARFMRIFKLPVYYKKVGHMKMSKITEDRVALWIVSTLGGSGVSQDYLDQLLKTLESYCQSANTGFWTQIIKSFLSKLSKFFVNRIKREQFREPFWNIKTPEHARLNDEDVRRFVVSMQSVAMSAIFSPVVFTEFTSIFQELATLRPDIVVPPLLDRLYATIDCVTEPHKLTAALQCVRAIARPMLTDGLNSTYSDGKKHVIPILFAVLPGIDPNDFQKSIVTLQFMTTFVNMIPLVDCSSCSQFSDLTAVEEEVASATSQFEEFILQYMDRIFTFIESVAQENVRIENNIHDDRNRVEKHLLILMESNCTTVFAQTSPEIFKVALKKMYNYAMVKILEIEVAGQAVAIMLKAFAAVNAEETYCLFIPKLCSYILEASRCSEVKNDDHLDHELLYKMLLLSEIVHGSPSDLKPYMSMLTDVLNETLHLKCKGGHDLSVRLLSNILLLFSNLHPLNFFDAASHESNRTFRVREWGRGITWKKLNIQWYCPGEEEISLVEQIFWKYLIPELDKVDKFNNDEIDYSRDEIRRMLNIIASLFSCSTLLKPWDKEPFLTRNKSQVPLSPVNLYVGIERHILMPDGSNVYKVLIDKMAPLQSKLLKKTDDTVSFKLLIKVWSYLLDYDVPLEMDYEGRKEFLKIWKAIYSNKVCATGSNIRCVLTEEIFVKHLQRLVYKESMLTRSHEVALISLFNLATSDYKPVQLIARNTLQALIIDYADNSCLMNGIVENLQVDTTEHKEKFKSTLALLKDRGRKKWFKSFTSSFEQLRSLLPAIVTSKPSEEITIVGLLKELTKNLAFTNWQFAIHIEISDNVVERAKELWAKSEFELLQSMPTDDEVKIGLMRLENRNNEVKREHEELINVLLKAIHHNNLQWRYELMTANFLAALLQPNEKCSLPMVQYFLKLLVHDSLVFRKIAVKVVLGILKLYKSKTIKEKVDPFSLASIDSVRQADGDDLIPGPRPDNVWCRYSVETVPKTETKWNEARYSYHCYLGFYGWPKNVYLCSSPAAQPVNNIDFDKLSDVGKEIDTFFLNELNVKKLIEYLSLEENKGEPLRCHHIYLFKYLFKIHCDRYFEIFKPHFEKLLACKEDSYQLCAAEMLAGIMMGTKLWPFDKAQRLIEWFVPLLRKIIDNMTVETQKHWGSAIAIALFNFDVNKNSYLLDVLLEEPIKGDASFKDCGRLYVLQSGVLHSWRLTELWNRLLEYIKPHLANRYQNLRERLGSVLVTIFETDIETTKWNRTLSPHVEDFINYLWPKLEILYSIAPNSNDLSNGEDSESGSGDGKIDNQNDSLEAIQLLKTVCKWCTNAAQRSAYPLKPDFFKVFPLLCFMENYDKDDELKKCCEQTLSHMSFSLVLLKDIPVFLGAFDEVCSSDSWCAKCTGLDFLQVFTFHNLFLISSRDEWVSRIIEKVLGLLIDNRCEVRQKAGEVISGFFHHHIIKEAPTLLEKFKTYSSVSLKKKKSNLNIRHAGVIGLCSFINAYPYTVPPEVPPLFADIGDHLKDPEPIPSTIRKTLGNFKRTHYSDWDQSKLKFTADQLEVFADIMIPPNHYA